MAKAVPYGGESKSLVCKFKVNLKQLNGNSQSPMSEGSSPSESSIVGVKVKVQFQAFFDFFKSGFIKFVTCLIQSPNHVTWVDSPDSQ